LLDVSSAQHSGTLLTGPLDEAVGEEALAQPWAVELRLAHVAELPAAGQPLSAREVVVDGAGSILHTRGELAFGVRRADDLSELGPVRWEARRLEVLWPGTTLVLRARRAENAPDAPRVPWEVLELELSRREETPDRVELSLALEGRVKPRPAEEDPRTDPELRREHVILDEGPRPGEPALRFLLPAPAEKARGAGYVAEVLVRVPGAEELATPAFAAALAGGRAALDDARRAAREGTSVFTSSEDFRRASLVALRELGRRGVQRQALIFLAAGSGAELTGDLALCAEAETLAECLAFVRRCVDESGAPAGDPAALGWFLESSVQRWLATRAGDPARELEPELEALLLRHAGELARYPDLVLESVRESADLAGLQRRFLEENRVFLADGDPAARVRAYDWLRRRGLAPEGYDPLGAPLERRAALARAEEAAASAALEEGGAR